MKIVLPLAALCFLNLQLQAQISFTNSSSPTVGNGPASISMADVNGDGKVELICANQFDNTLSVMTNNGNGGFVTAATYAVGSSPRYVTAADVNGDGKIDLISANQYGDTLSIMTNNGSGGFVLAASLGVGQPTYAVVAADINGDGKVDLTSANQNNTLTVWTNNGIGGFVVSGTYTVGTLPISLTAFTNVDGNVDLVSANYNANTLTVLTNNGSGRFAIAASLGVGNLPFHVTAADVNGDGKMDLISANYGNDTLTVWTNNGSGGFGLAASPAVGHQPYGLTATDVNGDGKVDLISGNYADGTLTVLTNNGSGGFGLAGTLVVGSGPIWVTATDVNGDGKMDLVSADYNTNILTVLLNTTPFPIRPSPTATGTAIVSFGFVVNVIVNYGGYGYTNTPLVRFIGGGGSGASAFAVVSNGVVTGITITNPGSGYTNAPLVVIDPPILNPVLSIAPASFLLFSNLTLNSSYQLQQSVLWYWTNLPTSFTATNGSYTQAVTGVVGSGNYRLALNPVPAQAFATPQVVNGFVVGATITSGGSGYVANPAVSFVGGSGANAAGTSQISGAGVVTNIIISNPGIGYTNAPTVEIGQPPTVALSPTVLPGMRVDASNLNPYENYQIQFTPYLNSTWGNVNGGLFTPTTVTNSQYILITNGTGFFRLQYLP
jgi:VCBS repeat protein/EF hand domain-containing protein